MAAQAGQGGAQNQAMAGMMTPMLVILGFMILLSVNPSLRTGLSGLAGTVIEPALPFHSEFFVPTVAIIGSSIMIVNTMIRGIFMDPLTQSTQPTETSR